MGALKPIRLTNHALEQCDERGTNESEVVHAIRFGVAEPAKVGRKLYRHNFAFDGRWQGRYYGLKQVAPVVAEEENELVVITVYTFFF